MKKGILMAVDEIVKELKVLSIPVGTKLQI
jgi:hypothetical protein